MNDTLFIQFYGKWNVIANDDCLGVSNGFSDTYDLCKKKGDFLWIEHEQDTKIESNIYKILTKCEQQKLPIKKGTVYVSATITSHAYQAYCWSKRYPNINFIVGGPAISTGSFLYNNLPNNLLFTNKTVEQFFGVNNYSYNWNLNLPKKIIKKKLGIFLIYSVGSNCYWNKCIFCRFDQKNHRQRKIFNFDFYKNINTKEKKIIFLYTPTVPPQLLKYLISNLHISDELLYFMFVRSGEKENKALEESLCKRSLLELKNIGLQFGFEFPGNKMLKYIKKGNTSENMIETLEILQKYNAYSYLSFIIGWPNLVKQDIKELKEFSKKAPRFEKDQPIFGRIWRLFARANTPIHDMVEKGEKINIGPFYIGSRIKLSKDQINLNNQARDILIDMEYNLVDNYTKTLE